jgi:hypothetical protein
VTKAHPETSSYTLELPPSSTIHNTFHISQLQKFVPNDDHTFPGRGNGNPEPILVEGDWEHVIEKLIDKRKRGKGMQYLVRWKGFSSAHDKWIPQRWLKENAALDKWEKEKESCTEELQV